MKFSRNNLVVLSIMFFIFVNLKNSFGQIVQNKNGLLDLNNLHAVTKSVLGVSKDKLFDKVHHELKKSSPNISLISSKTSKKKNSSVNIHVLYCSDQEYLAILEFPKELTGTIGPYSQIDHWNFLFEGELFSYVTGNSTRPLISYPGDVTFLAKGMVHNFHIPKYAHLLEYGRGKIFQGGGPEKIGKSCGDQVLQRLKVRFKIQG